MSTKKITIIGGGTGTATVLNGLKESDNLELSAVVAVSDNGGSTGRLRDEFGFLPIGDIRQCLAALASGESQKDVRDLLLYRFEQGEGLKGHNLGNLILTALSDVSNSPAEAIEKATTIFAVKGSVFPITEKSIDLVVEYEDGEVVIGEKHLDELDRKNKKIDSLKISPRAQIFPGSAEAIVNSDMIIVGPGDIYASLVPPALVDGCKNAVKDQQGIFVFVMNLMTHASQTHGMTAQDHVAEITKYYGRCPDYVVMNSGKIPQNVLERYEQVGDFPVIDDVGDGESVVRENFVFNQIFEKNSSDVAPRSLIRHDSQKLAKVLCKL